jgi:replication-associated recombination protein RarA
MQSRSPEQPEPPLSPACILLLNGFPGVGKFTIAKFLCSSLITSNTPYRLLDNHFIIDAAHAIIPDRSPSNYALRKQFRKVAFDGLKALEEEKLVVVLTACLVNTGDDLNLFEEYLDIAKARRVPLVMVNLLCDMRSNIGRLESEERKSNGEMKLVDKDVLEKIRQEASLLHRETVMKCVKREEVFYSEVDTSNFDIKQAVESLLRLLCEVRME